MANISVISPMVDKDSVSALSSMIDPETSINNLVDHAKTNRKIGLLFISYCLLPLIPFVLNIKHILWILLERFIKCICVIFPYGLVHAETF